MMTGEPRRYLGGTSITKRATSIRFEARLPTGEDPTVDLVLRAGAGRLAGGGRSRDRTASWRRSVVVPR
jgi:hypothetical protein